MNKVILMGRLVKDPEARTVGDGISIARFTIAVDRRFTGKDGQRQADFINCTAWRQTGEFICRYFHKGNMIAVIGELQTRTWEDDTGQKRYATEVNVSEAYFTGEKSGATNQTTGFDTLGFEDFGENEDDLPF